MSREFVSCWEFSLQQRALHKLAIILSEKFIFKDFIKKEVFEYDDAEEWYCNYLESIPDISDKIELYESKLTERFSYQLDNAMSNLICGYWKAYLWETIYPISLSFTILNPMSEGKYKAGCFIDLSGHFNDFDWVKHFITDNDQFIHNRFELACLYCLKDDIIDLWHTMKSKRQLPCKGNLKAIKYIFDYLVALWAYKLENKLYKLFESKPLYIDNFYVLGLKHAISKCYECAVKYFWAHSSKLQLTWLITRKEFLQDLANVAKWEQVDLLIYIYSRLTFEEKRNLIRNAINPRKCMYVAQIWECLILSPFYESALSDILIFYYYIPSEVFENLLTSLSLKIDKREDSATNKKIFEILWNLLLSEQRIKVLELSEDLIINLSKELEIDLLKIIILSLPFYEKENMLLYDWRRADVSALEEFYNDGDYDSMHQYVLFFLQDQDFTTRKLSLRIDAYNFLDVFRKQIFIYSSEKLISNDFKSKLENIIEILLGSLEILNTMLEDMEGEISQ